MPSRSSVALFALARLAASGLLVMLSTGCYLSHRLDHSVDAGADAGDAVTDLGDAHTTDLSDASPDLGPPECPLDVAGPWFVTLVRSPDSCFLGEDSFVEFGPSGLQQNQEDWCSRPGCTPENCTFQALTRADCTASIQASSPCLGLSRGASGGSTYHYLSDNRMEGEGRMGFPEGTCRTRFTATR